MNTIDGARVYRFHDTVAISFELEDQQSPTLYLDRDMAHKVAILLNKTGTDIRLWKFTESKLGTWLVKKVNDTTRLWTARIEKE